MRSGFTTILLSSFTIQIGYFLPGLCFWCQTLLRICHCYRSCLPYSALQSINALSMTSIACIFPEKVRISEEIKLNRVIAPICSIPKICHSTIFNIWVLRISDCRKFGIVSSFDCFPSSDDVVEELQRYKEQTKVDGETLVRTVFPKRVFEMRELLASKLFNFEPASVYQKVNLPVPLTGEQNGVPPAGAGLHPDGDGTVQKPLTGSPVFTFPGGVVSHNTHIKAMIEHDMVKMQHYEEDSRLRKYPPIPTGATKPHLTQLMVEAQLVRMWIQFNVPRIEDGNNFGVSIQEDVLSEVSGIERDALTFLDQFTRYYASRGKLVGKAAKFPHIDDYRECIRDMDEKQAISMRYVIMEIRNHYAVLHDLIVKNLDRIKVPRSNNTMTMY
ncbi:Proteasome activator complex subunit 3 [Taenia solium]|eukprot:TsM_000294900 transcript=TsM_000294900 gene=TsM_000294900